MRTPTSFYLQNQILNGPNDVLFTLLIFILSKNLNATAFELMVIACLKPITSLFSFYISSILHGKPHRIRPYLMMNMFMGATSCFLFPFINHIWFYILSYAIYKISERAQKPAWIELLKSSQELTAMSKTISRGTSISFFISMLLPPILSYWLDEHYWRYLFFIGGIFQFINLSIVFFKFRSLKTSKPVDETYKFEIQNADLSQKQTATNFSNEKIYTQESTTHEKFSVNNIFSKFKDPLNKAWQILRYNAPFSHYLFLYFLGGAGIILMQPVLPLYYKNHLHLSYQQLTLAFSFCKGISFLISSPLWAKYMRKISLYRMNAYMNVLTSLFVCGVLASSSFGTEWLYVGYLFYGAMQGGCELSLNMSGAIFSKKNDSTSYSSLNLLLIGVRGCICPFLGYTIFSYSNETFVFLTTLSICLIGVIYGLWLDSKYSTASLRPATQLN